MVAWWRRSRELDQQRKAGTAMSVNAPPEKSTEDQIALNDDDFDFVAYARDAMVRHEREWRDAGLTVRWIDTRPKWIPVTYWSVAHDAHPGNVEQAPLIDPTAPCRRAWRFSLIGGGQIKIVEHWVETREPPPFSPTWNQRTDIVVAAHADDRLRVYRGEIDDIGCEMQACAVVLRGIGDDIQAVADRVGATLRALTEDESSSEITPPDRDRFYALLDGARGCSICRRPLRDEISKLIGVGPDCARQWQIPHSRAAASKRLELRAQMLGARE
jgi:hypothetical protein